ncbi:MAG: hypothetical protein ACI8Z9_000397, partial [Paraglaciecola sp.]
MVKFLQTRATPRIKLSWLVLLSVAIFAFGAQANTLPEFEAKYTAFRYGKDLGQATLALHSLGRDKYRLNYESRISLFFLSDKRSETSFFSFSEQQLLPYKYQYARTGTGSDKKTEVLFDQHQQIIQINDENPVAWQGELDNQLYRLDLQFKLAQGETKFSYKVVNNRGQLREYVMEVVGKEQLDLPYGKLEGIKVNMLRKNSSRHTSAWFSPELNYQLVRLQQFKDGEEQGEIQLKE